MAKKKKSTVAATRRRLAAKTPPAKASDYLTSLAKYHKQHPDMRVVRYVESQLDLSTLTEVQTLRKRHYVIILINETFLLWLLFLLIVLAQLRLTERF